MTNFLTLCYVVPAVVALLAWGYIIAIVLYLCWELRK